jgi:hypothetical protein
MMRVEDIWWMQLCKKTGLALPTLEEAEAELGAAKPIPLSEDTIKVIVAASEKTISAIPGRRMSEVPHIFGAATASREKPPLFERLEQILVQIGSPLVEVASHAIGEFLAFKRSHEDQLFAFCRERLSACSSPADRQILERAVNPLGPVAEIVAYYDQTVSVSPGEAHGWIEHPFTRISTLVSTPERQIFLALVDSERVVPLMPCKAFWFRPSKECHVFVISRSLAEGQDRPLAICHEMQEMQEMLTCFNHSLLCKRMEDSRMTSAIGEKEVESRLKREEYHDQDTKKMPYVIEQMGLDAKDKLLVATWVALHLCLKDGAGILLDAGSACFQMWEKIVGQIHGGDLRFLVVYTNSFLVLENWGKRLTSPGVQRTLMELTGTKLDWEHLAFYGPVAIQKVMNPGFRATNVYIGTSGMEFDEKTGSIRFGYRGPGDEPEWKELLFKCRASRRIILATPRKIGEAGGRAFNILDTQDLFTDAPIYLVTTNPEKGSEYEKQFKQALDAFQSEAVEQAIVSKGLEFHWITIDRESNDVPKKLYEIEVSKRAKESRSRQDNHEVAISRGSEQQQ